MRHLSQGSQDGDQKQHSFRITLTLIITVVMFILLICPCEIMHFLDNISHMRSEVIETFLVLRAVVNLLQVLNFSCNACDVIKVAVCLHLDSIEKTILGSPLS